MRLQSLCSEDRTLAIVAILNFSWEGYQELIGFNYIIMQHFDCGYFYQKISIGFITNLVNIYENSYVGFKFVFIRICIKI